MLYESMTELIGNTPLLEAKNIKQELGLQANLFLKLEYFNPGGSVKDRIAFAMIQKAQTSGTLTKDSVIIEPTSGNTGIGLAAIAASMGIRIILTMPETMSLERRTLLSAYGAEIVLTDGALGMQGAISKANELAKSIEGAFIPSQFDNPSNPLMHYQTTGPEIYEDLKSKVDVFVAGVGTGGTVTGTAQYLKENIKDLHVVAVEPMDSAVLSGESAGPHEIQGIGAGFIPSIYNETLIDEIKKVTNEDAYTFSKLVAQKEGILVGISSGAALKAACDLAKREEYKGKNIVVIMPDTGERYLSTKLFKE